MFSPTSLVFHLGGGSLPMGAPRKVYYNFRNSLFMLWKNLPATQLWYKIPVRFGLDALAALRAILGKHPTEFIAILRAYIHFFKAMPQIHKKRASIHQHPTAQVLSPVVIVWQYFVLKKTRFSDFMK